MAFSPLSDEQKVMSMFYEVLKKFSRSGTGKNLQRDL